MKVLLINKFLYPRGGAELSTLNTGALLEARGHKVMFWGMKHPKNPPYSHEDLFVPEVDYGQPGGALAQARAAMNILYSFEARRKLERLIERERPDIVHLNNFAHQISPSILHVLDRMGVPSVMTMRDLKMVCASYLMLAGDKPCERCKGGRYYHCFLTRCTKGSRAKSLVNVAEMYLHHDVLNIYDLIDVFVAPSQFLRAKTREMGFGREVRYLPNFVDLKGWEPRYDFSDRAITYVGRLSAEKGVDSLLSAVKGLNAELRIIGEGPQEEELRRRASEEGIANARFLGFKSGAELRSLISSSMGLILPSICYENNPRSVLEAFALGKPALGSRIGGIPELIRDGETGFVFEAGNPADIRAKIDAFLSDPGRIPEMGRQGRASVEERFNPERHYGELLSIYEDAIRARRERG